jgi:hypothetical protein
MSQSTEEEKLEVGLEESMDGSDSPTASQPGCCNEPVPSSGFPEKKNWLERLKGKIFNK